MGAPAIMNLIRKITPLLLKRALAQLTAYSLFAATSASGALLIEVSESGGRLLWEVAGELPILAVSQPGGRWSTCTASGFSLFDVVVIGKGSNGTGDGFSGAGLYDLWHTPGASLQSGSAAWSGAEGVGGSANGATFFVSDTGDLGVPIGFTGGPLALSTSTAGSFAAYGMAIGESRTWVLGGNVDTITFTAVPEPSAAFLSLFPACALLCSRRRLPFHRVYRRYGAL